MLNGLPKTVSFSILIHIYSRERKLLLILKKVKKKRLIGHHTRLGKK